MHGVAGGRHIVIVAAVLCASPGAQPEALARDGVWIERTQVAVDALTQQPVRRAVRICSPAALAGFDVTWQPDVAPGILSDGTAHGSGRLEWREPEAAPYDRSAVVATYVGEVRNGRAHGYGVLRDYSGLSFAGTWEKGAISGSGVLKTADGKDYEGELRNGRPHGTGQEVGADGATYVGSFNAGLRDGPGLLTRPDGTRWSGIWRSGTLTDEPLRAERPAPIRLAQASDGATVTVYIDRAKNREDETKSMDMGGAGVVLYEHQTSGGTVRLRPKGFPDKNAVDVLGIWKGNAVIEKDSRDISYGPANIVVDIKNNGNAPLQIIDGYLDVTESVTDLQPYVTLSSDLIPECVEGNEKLNPKFTFGNLGWGRLEDTRVSYTFARRAAGGDGGSFTANLGTFLDSKEMTVLPGLRDLGVDVRRLELETFACESRGAVPQCLRRLIDRGTLGRLPAASVRRGTTSSGLIVADVSGEITYSWTDAKGVRHARRSLYALEVPLLSFRVGSTAECGAGGPTDVHPRVKLRSDQANYRLPIQYRTTINPGQNRRLTLPVGADKSSQHTFRVMLRRSDNSVIASGPIELLYFKAREAVVR